MLDERDRASTAEHRQRVKIMNAVWAVYERRESVAYSQARPSQLLSHALPVRAAARLITRADCSGLAALGLDWANVRPGGRKVDWRYVNTWVLLSLFPHETPLDRLEPGDLVFYGPKPGDPHHVAIYKQDGMVVTNGHHPMSVERVDYRPDRIHARAIL